MTEKQQVNDILHEHSQHSQHSLCEPAAAAVCSCDQCFMKLSQLSSAQRSGSMCYCVLWCALPALGLWPRLHWSSITVLLKSAKSVSHPSQHSKTWLLNSWCWSMSTKYRDHLKITYFSKTSTFHNFISKKYGRLNIWMLARFCKSRWVKFNSSNNKLNVKTYPSSV